MRIRRIVGALAAATVAVAGLGTIAQKAEAIACAASDPATLNAALTNPACDTINASAGSYTGPFPVTRSVVINGPNAGVSPNTATRSGEALVTSAGDGFSLNAQGITVTIDGFSINAAGFAVREKDVASTAEVL